MKMKPVKDNKHLFRDVNSNAIVNTNIDDYNAYISQRDKRENEKKRVRNLEGEIHSMKNDIEEIKNLLKSIIK